MRTLPGKQYHPNKVRQGKDDDSQQGGCDLGYHHVLRPHLIRQVKGNDLTGGEQPSTEEHPGTL